MRHRVPWVLPFLAVPLLAQPVVQRVDVRVVNVDVTAVDGSGRAVTDLAKDDFEILEDGQPQAITNFLLINRPSPGAARTSTDIQLRRRIILLVDNNYIERTDRDAALRTLDQFVDTTYDGTYEWALGMIGQQLEVVQPFTADKAAIHAAIARIRKSTVTSMHDMFDRSLLDDQLYQRDGLDVPAAFESRERTTRNAQSLANTARGLIDAVHAFAAIEGKKLAVLLTGVVDLNTAYNAFDTGTDNELRDAKRSAHRMIEAIVQEANAANMSIHVIRAAGHSTAVAQHDVNNQSSGRGVEGVNINGDSDIADTSPGYTIASGTGGLFLTSNTVRQSFSAIDSAAGAFYLLGYSPAHAEDQKYHRITVRVKKAGLRVVHRQGYLDLTEDQRLERLLRLRASLLQPASAVPVTVNVQSPPATPDGKPVVSIFAAMPMARVSLLPGAGRFTGRVHVYLSIFDAQGRNVGFHHKMQDLALTAAERERALADAFRYRMNVRLDRGEFTLAVTLRDDLSNEIGTAVRKVKF
jgi:VWFA-related protein